MAGYTMRTYEDRMTIQEMWNDGARAAEIAEKLKIQLSSLYSELSRGQDGSRLQNQRLRYNADFSKKSIGNSENSGTVRDQPGILGRRDRDGRSV